jgi:hypothetical protein
MERADEVLADDAVVRTVCHSYKGRENDVADFTTEVLAVSATRFLRCAYYGQRNKFREQFRLRLILLKRSDLWGRLLHAATSS